MATPAGFTNFASQKRRGPKKLAEMTPEELEAHEAKVAALSLKPKKVLSPEHLAKLKAGIEGARAARLASPPPPPPGTVASATPDGMKNIIQVSPPPTQRLVGAILKFSDETELQFNGGKRRQTYRRKNKKLKRSKSKTKSKAKRKP